MQFERDERKFDFHDIGREIKRKREASGCKSRIDVMLSSMDEKDLRLVGTFPDGNSALMLVCARLRHVAGTQWGNKKYMNMKRLEAALDDTSIAG